MQSNGSAPIHVLVVSNHWNKANEKTHFSVWADRQIVALRALGVKISTFDIGTSHSPKHLFERWRALRKAVKELNPDVVHARYGSLVGWLSVWSGKPSIITYAGSDLLVDTGIPKFRAHLSHTVSHLAALRADGLICVSEQLRQILWWRNASAEVIPDGVNLEHFKPYPRDESRQRLGWALDEKVVLMDAMRAPILKGLKYGQEAIEMVKKQIPNARLELISKVNPADMPYYFCASDVLLCASSTEGSPNIVKEAMACNLPVVSTDVGDVRERLEHVTPSRIVARESQPIAEALCEVLKLGQRSNGRDHVGEMSLERIASRVLGVYERVVGRKQPRILEPVH